MKPEDVIGILNRKVQNATVTEDQIDAAVEKYHKTHPLETDKTLTVPGAFADAKAVGDELAGKVSGIGIELFYNEEKQCLAVKVEG
jgi:hypothetical protein